MRWTALMHNLDLWIKRALISTRQAPRMIQTLCELWPQLEAFKVAERGTAAWTHRKEQAVAAAAEAAKSPEQRRKEADHAALLERLRAEAKVPLRQPLCPEEGIFSDKSYRWKAFSMPKPQTCSTTPGG